MDRHLVITLYRMLIFKGQLNSNFGKNFFVLELGAWYRLPSQWVLLTKEGIERKNIWCLYLFSILLYVPHTNSECWLFSETNMAGYFPRRIFGSNKRRQNCWRDIVILVGIMVYHSSDILKFTIHVIYVRDMQISIVLGLD